MYYQFISANITYDDDVMHDNVIAQKTDKGW